MARSLNRVQLIGNLTRDPELRYTPAGSAVCTFSLATNRYWTTETGEKKEDAEFHRIVAWNKLAELCAQLLAKGRKVYVEGRLQTRRWTGQDGVDRYTTEIVINDMIILDSKLAAAADFDIPDEMEAISPPDIMTQVESKEEAPPSTPPATLSGATAVAKKTKPAKKEVKEEKSDEDKDVEEEDIPF